MTQYTFTEKQRFSRKFMIPLVVLITIFTSGLSVWGLIQQIALGIPFGNHPVSDTGLLITNILVLIFIVLLDWLLLIANLITEISSEAITYRFFPFINKKRTIPWHDIEKAYIRQYSPLKEYGGWGIRFGSNGRAINLKGNQGLQLEFRNGKKLLIGTQKPEELQKFLIQLGKSS
jgi:hypothetical protein